VGCVSVWNEWLFYDEWDRKGPVPWLLFGWGGRFRFNYVTPSPLWPLPRRGLSVCCRLAYTVLHGVRREKVPSFSGLMLFGVHVNVLLNVGKNGFN
jgi:hypothetical protein